MSEDFRIAAIVPVASIEGAKTRLGESLDAEERHDLVERLLVRTLEALRGARRLSDVLVVSPDRAVLELAAASGVRTLRQRSTGLNPGIRDGRDDVVAGGAEAIVIVPIDLPFITPDAIDEVALAVSGGTSPVVVLVTDRHGTGTNVLALRPPDAIELAFGVGSRDRHRLAASEAVATYREIAGPLTVDLDTPDDLVFVESLSPDGLRVG